MKNYYFVPLNEESYYESFRREGFVSTVFLSLITPSILYYIFQKESGNPISIPKSLQHGFKTWPKIVGYGLLKNIIIIAGLFFLIVPGILFMYRLFFLFVIITLEGTKGIDPVSKSNSMAKGKGWTLFFCSIIVTLTMILPVFMVSMILAFSDGWAANTFIDLMIDLAFVLFTVMSLIMYMAIKKEEERES